MIWISLVPLLLSGFPQQPTQKIEIYTISGVLVEHSTDRPLAHMAVGLALTDRPNEEIAFRTDNNGRFAFSVPAGKYSLVAHGRDGTYQLYREDEGFSTGIVAGPGVDSSHIVFPVKKPTSISGTVTNEEGDPVGGAQILLFRKAVSFGKEEVTQYGGAMTGSDGVFHQGHLPAGTYYIAVSARPWYAQNTSGFESRAAGNSDLDVTYPLTYYGNVQDARLATPLQLTEGAAAKIQVVVSTVKAVHVLLPDLPASKAQQNVQLLAEGPGGVVISSSAVEEVGESSNGSTPHRAIVGIAPGRYMLQFSEISNGQVQTTKIADVEISGNGPLNSVGRTSATLSGKVKFDDGLKPPSSLGIRLSCAQQYFPIGPDGSFSWTHFDLPPGKCQVQVMGVEKKFYVSAIWLNGKRLPGDLADIPAGTDVTVTIEVRKGDLSKLTGVALKDGKPHAGAMVLVLPEDLSRTLSIGRDQSDSDGSFGIDGAQPGHYRIVAVDDGTNLAYQESEVIRAYLPGGVEVTLPTSSETTIQVPVQPRR